MADPLVPAPVDPTVPAPPALGLDQPVPQAQATPQAHVG